jgi:hypothetical protein
MIFGKSISQNLQNDVQINVNKTAAVLDQPRSLTMIQTPLLTADFAMLPFALLYEPLWALCLMGSFKSWCCHLYPGFEFPRLARSRSHQDAAVGEWARFLASQSDH